VFSCINSHAENLAESSSTYTARDSGMFSVFDPNYDSNSVLGELLMISKGFALIYFSDIMIEDDSPYPEVRSAVANFDDPEMPASTLRAWILGIFWAILLPGMNQFFFFRYPSVSIGGVSADLFKSV